MKTAGLAKLIQDLIADLLREFILHPDSLKVSAVPLAQSISIRIEVHTGDMGRIIGEKGAHFRALESLCLCAGLKHGVAINLAPIAEPKGGRPDRYEKFKARDDWRYSEILSLLERAAKMIFKSEEAISLTTTDEDEHLTIVTVNVARRESYEVIVAGSLALRTLFNAVGKANGRTIFVQVAAANDTDPPQPKSAAGRFSRELRR